jgi:hypothetical protein
MTPKETVNSREQIESANVSYWLPDHRGRPTDMTDLRWKFHLEAEAARERWAQLDRDGPNGKAKRERERRFKRDSNDANDVHHSSSAPMCDMSECKDTGDDVTLSANSPEASNGVQTHRCKVCGKEFSSTRSDASLCSAKCRKRASRASTKD